MSRRTGTALPVAGPNSPVAKASSSELRTSQTETIEGGWSDCQAGPAKRNYLPGNKGPTARIGRVWPGGHEGRAVGPTLLLLTAFRQRGLLFQGLSNRADARSDSHEIEPVLPVMQAR